MASSSAYWPCRPARSSPSNCSDWVSPQCSSGSASRSPSGPRRGPSGHARGGRGRSTRRAARRRSPRCARGEPASVGRVHDPRRGGEHPDARGRLPGDAVPVSQPAASPRGVTGPPTTPTRARSPTATTGGCRTSPSWPGEGFSHHFLADFFGAVFTVSGVPPSQSLVISAWMLAVVPPLLLWCGVLRVVGSRTAAGDRGAPLHAEWRPRVVVLRRRPRSRTVGGALGSLPRTYARIGEQHIWVDNTISASFYAQRSTQLGWAIGATALVLLLASRPNLELCRLRPRRAC